MRMRTATSSPLQDQGSGVLASSQSNEKRMRSATAPPAPRTHSCGGLFATCRGIYPASCKLAATLPFLLAFLLALLGPLLGALAVACADLGLEHLRPRHEGAHLAHAGEHLQPLPHAHLRH